MTDRKIVAITVVKRDGFYRTATLDLTGQIREWAAEGAGSYPSEEPDAIKLAKEWGVYYVPNHYAADNDRLESIQRDLARDKSPTYYSAISMLRSSQHWPLTRAQVEAGGNPGHQYGGVVVGAK